MPVAGERRAVTAHIESLTAADGKDGQEQWEVKLRWPWTPKGAKYPDITWVDAENVPEWGARTKGEVVVTVEADRLKTNADKQPYDGTREWMWTWRIWGLAAREDVTASRPPASMQRTGAASQDPSGGRGDLDRRIAWNSAINNATALVVGTFALPESERDLYWSADAGMEDAISRWAEWYYRAILAGPVAAGDPEPAPAPPVAPEPRPQQARAGTRGAAEPSGGADPMLSALADLKDARLAAGVSRDRLQGEARARYESDIMALSLRQVRELTAALTAGEMGPG